MMYSDDEVMKSDDVLNDDVLNDVLNDDVNDDVVVMDTT